MTASLHDAPAPAITVRGLTKRFGSVTAVDDLDLTVRRGTVHGFLGPNGAGKSTTIRAILGMLRPDAGTIGVLGHDPVRDPASATARVAYVPGDVALWPQLTGGEALATMAKLRAGGAGTSRGSAGDDPARRAELIERFRLDTSKRIRDYSKGNRQKVMLVAGLAADVDVLVLDEPTSGLDPLMEREFAACVRERVAEGASVLLSSHILSEVQDLADDITIIRDGRLVESGSLKDLTHLRGSRLQATLPDGSRVDRLLPRDDVPAALSDLLARGAADISCTDAGLEDIFLDHYSGTSAPGSGADDAPAGPSSSETRAAHGTRHARAARRSREAGDAR
ncbi:ABC transporter ATP-binding protein [Corynebacterium hansenii]|uniref:ABC transporter ATP-binding protein n=1 Tax=Corynebacterium hansenii TaxID=394964 RepID=A0ABV7ZNZ7_9CORY|nr:ABC transporter ATP-binding protein [Corynebacterium hansenii]WJY99064.1 Daunorubicin/doxorubicin resistance ATP-binding protein DrrA [Corynebacterium hansenii]